MSCGRRWVEVSIRLGGIRPEERGSRGMNDKMAEEPAQRPLD